MILSRRHVFAGLSGALLSPVAACGQATEPAAPAASARVVDLTAPALNDAFALAAQLPQLRSMIVAQHGRTVREQVFRGAGLDTPVNIKSASKTIIAALVGCAIDRKVLTGLDQPIGSILGARIPATADPRVKALTIENLVSMAAGLERTSGQNYGRWVSSRDWVAYALTRPFVAEPGGQMLYSTGSSHILSAVLTRASGRSTLDLAREWLGRPLGVVVPPWTRDPQGIYFGGNEMALAPRSLLKFGEMYRNGGTVGSTPVLSADYVQDSWRSRGGRSPFTGYTYGLGWWLRETGGTKVNFAWGYGGQMLYVAPDLGLTVVMISDPTARGGDGHVPALHQLLDETIVARARSV